MNPSHHSDIGSSKQLTARPSATSSSAISPSVLCSSSHYQHHRTFPQYPEQSYGPIDPTPRTTNHWPSSYVAAGPPQPALTSTSTPSMGSLPPAEPGSFRYPPRIIDPTGSSANDREAAQRAVLLPPLQQAPPSRAWPPANLASPAGSSGSNSYAFSYPPPTAPWGREVACSLRMRQQPQVARACGFGERDRRAVDPPPVLELDIERQTSGGISDVEELNLSHYIVHACLYSEDGMTDVGTFLQQPRTAARRLVGSLAATPAVAADELGHKGAYFTFADLSCREPGRYRIKFTLVRIDSGTSPLLASTMSDCFRVYTPKDFPGMRQPTPLTNALKIQGVSIPAKKGRNNTVPKQSRGQSEEEMRD